MTAKGAALLREELQNLKSVKRPSIINVNLLKPWARWFKRKCLKYQCSTWATELLWRTYSRHRSKLSNIQNLMSPRWPNNVKWIFWWRQWPILNSGYRRRDNLQNSLAKMKPNIKNNLISYRLAIARVLIGKSDRWCGQYSNAKGNHWIWNFSVEYVLSLLSLDLLIDLKEGLGLFLMSENRLKPSYP